MNSDPFNPCIPRAVKCGSKVVYVFDTLYFQIRGKRYKLIAAENHPKDVLHTVMNIDTREIRNVPHSRLIEWFSELK